MGERPLSPHLGIYRFWYPMVTSITHRITGLGLALGLIVLVWWLLDRNSWTTTIALVALAVTLVISFVRWVISR